MRRHRESDPVVDAPSVVGKPIEGVAVLAQRAQGIWGLRTLGAVAEQDVDSSGFQFCLASEHLVVRDVDGSGKSHSAAGVRDSGVHELSALAYEVGHFKFSDRSNPGDRLEGLDLPPSRLHDDHLRFAGGSRHVLRVSRAGTARASQSSHPFVLPEAPGGNPRTPRLG